MSVASLWHSRSARERSLATAGVAVLGVMLVVALVWLPLERTRQRLLPTFPSCAPPSPRSSATPSR